MCSNKLIEIIKTDLYVNRMYEEKYMNLIEDLPEGSLHCKTVSKTKRYYHYSPNVEKGSSNRLVYISNKNELLLNELIKKSFAEKSLIFLRNNITAQEAFLPNKTIYPVFNPDLVYGILLHVCLAG
jgi:hypothetical protein